MLNNCQGQRVVVYAVVAVVVVAVGFSFRI